MSKKKNPPHRPTLLLDDDIKRKILASLTMGMTIKEACIFAEIDESTFYNWRKNYSEDPQFKDFFKSLKKAEVQGKMKHIQKIFEEQSWQASAWWLERKFPEEFARREKVQLSGDEKNPVVVKEIKEALSKLELNMEDKNIPE